jgi:hypothetical protein
MQGETASKVPAVNVTDSLVITGSFTYDLLYREKVYDSLNEAIKDIGIYGLNGVTRLEYPFKNGGLYSFWEYKNAFIKWIDDRNYISISPNARIQMIYGGGWLRKGPLVLECAAGVNPSYLKKAATSDESSSDKVAVAFKSPGIDINSEVKVNCGNWTFGLLYNNVSPFAGNTYWETKSNSHRRRLPLVMNSNRYGLFFNYAVKQRVVSVTSILDAMGSGSIREKSYDLPLHTRGFGNLTSAAFVFRDLPYRPSFTISELYYRFSVDGKDADEDRFFRSDDNRFFSIDGTLALSITGKSTAGAVGSFMEGDDDWGYCFTYPFTDLALLPGVPDRYRYSEGNMKISEAGIFGKRVFIPVKGHIFKSDVTITGYRVRGKLRIEDQDYSPETYLLPNTIKEKTVLIEKRYLVFKGILEYVFSRENYDAQVSIQQTVPFEVSSKGKSGASDSRETSETRYLYGGLRAGCSLTWRIKKSGKERE